MNRLNGKTAVITGGATGIGRAAAKRFIEEGAFVFIFGRRQEALDAAVAELGPNARAVKGSVSDEADLDRLYAAVKAERGTLDIVFANAGAGSQLALGKITAEHIDEIRFRSQGDRVLVVGVATGKIKATNKPFRDDWVFDITVRDGKVTNIREYIDTQALARASQMDASGLA
jgi:UDP-glucose 4-epimerase